MDKEQVELDGKLLTIEELLEQYQTTQAELARLKKSEKKAVPTVGSRCITVRTASSVSHLTEILIF